MNAVLQGAGLGLRRELINDLSRTIPDAIQFFELAPENWMEVGGQWRKQLRHFSTERPVVAHGLSLSLGSLDPLDEGFVQRIGHFLDEYNIPLYTEHLSWCSDEGHLYDLLPIPFTFDAVEHVASRIRRVQEILQRRIAIENASYYVAPPMAEMSEAEFICAVLKAADCDLHLDVNNIYVNSINFNFDPHPFIQQLPAERVVYMHMAGHYQKSQDLIIDTHGADVIESVWELLAYTYQQIGIHPTLLERDFNIPPLSTLLPEVERIAQLQIEAGKHEQVA
ncbi:MAG: DUF692 domain-containing protein [Gammaproteobacteria bacterium]|nr:DUF692 domain-containing protein [Gammaproteobacteria bacterium]